LRSRDYENFLLYKKYKQQFIENKGKKWKVNKDYIENFISTNPEFYYTYWLIGDYYKGNEKDFAMALKYYQTALAKEVPRDNEIEYLKKAVQTCNENLLQ